MIKLEKTEVIGWEAAIRGMRNPMNSWERSDSCWKYLYEEGAEEADCIGPNDHDLMMRLAKGGPVHAKYRRMIVVYVDITAPLYFWKEFDTYRTGVTPNPMDIEMNSCSTMHKIHEKEFTLEDFSHEHMNEDSKRLLLDAIHMLNIYRVYYNGENTYEWYCKNDPGQTYRNYSKKDIWWQMIQLLPSSYNQKRTVMLNYEVLHNMYFSRGNHKLDEWREFCKWIESFPYSEIITLKTTSQNASVTHQEAI